jgi:hypothetical protein
MQSLLKNEALAVSAVDYLPGFLPSAPKEDFACRGTEIWKAMVKAWPFPCLPLGSLTKTRDLGTLQIALSGIDLLLGQEVHRRR